MTKYVYKKIYYREAYINDCQRTLQDLLSEALKSTTPNDRQEKLNEDEKTFRLINKHEKYRGTTFCQMLLVDPGASQAVLTSNTQADSYAIEGLSTKDLYKNNSDFVNSILYFGVKNNEIVIMPTHALNARAVESHLSWLLGSKTSLLPEESILSLNRTLPSEFDELIKAHPITCLEIGSPLSNREPSSDDVYNESNTFNVGISAIKAAMGKYFNSSWLKNIDQSSNISAKVVISYKRSTNEAGRKLMDTLGRTFRNIDDADIHVHLKDVGEIKQDKINESKKIKIGKTKQGLFVNTDIYQEINNWLIELNTKRES